MVPIESKFNSLPLPTIKRLPQYLEYLERLKNQGVEHVSASEIALEFGLIPIQVRKDLSATGAIGKPRIGFNTKLLAESIRNNLGWKNVSDAFLIGAGGLGSSLLGYSGFKKQGLSIVAAFDNNPALCGTKIHGKDVFPLSKFPNLVKRMKIPIAILTVPETAAQDICNMAIAAGIKAIWNFAPVTLSVPDTIIVQNENLAMGLAVLSSRLNEAGN